MIDIHVLYTFLLAMTTKQVQCPSRQQLFPKDKLQMTVYLKLFKSEQGMKIIFFQEYPKENVDLH